MGEAARALAVERYAWPAIADGSKRSTPASPASASGRHTPREEGAARLALGLGAGRSSLSPRSCSRSSSSGGAARTGERVLDAFKVVIWSWIVLAFLLNVVSTLFRALSWRLTVGQALPPEHQPRLVHVLSSFGVGLLANAVVPGRLGELARVATLRRHLPDAPPGTSAILVGTVFAHRLFDLVPASILVVWVLLTAEVPHWAVVSITIAAAVGFALFTVAWLGARRHDRPVMSEGMGSRRQLVVMGRQGLSVLKAPVPLAGADLAPVHGLADAAPRGVRRDAGVRDRRAASRRRPRPRAHEHRDDRAALAREHRARAGSRRDPARNYGVPYAIGFAYGLALQAIEIACGVTLGLIAIAREGISFAMLRRMEDDERSAEDALEGVNDMVDDLDEDAEHDAEAARESAAVSR